MVLKKVLIERVKKMKMFLPIEGLVYGIVVELLVNGIAAVRQFF